MKSQITLSQLMDIYERRDVFLSEKSATEMLEQCNEQADEIYQHFTTGEALPTRSATEWAIYFADQEAHQNRCDAMAYADFSRDAYGE